MSPIHQRNPGCISGYPASYFLCRLAITSRACGVGTHWDTVLVEEPDHFSINSRVGLRIAAIARARICDIWSRGVTQPIVIDPACAGATGAVHVDLDAAGEQAVVAE